MLAGPPIKKPEKPAPLSPDTGGGRIEAGEHGIAHDRRAGRKGSQSVPRSQSDGLRGEAGCLRVET
jgi:hypothetical protein